MVRVRNVIFGDSTDFANLPAQAVPGTFFFNTTTKELYIKDTTTKWYNTNGSASQDTEDYHEGV